MGAREHDSLESPWDEDEDQKPKRWQDGATLPFFSCQICYTEKSSSSSGFGGSCVALTQDVGVVAQSLPRRLGDLDVVNFPSRLMFPKKAVQLCGKRFVCDDML